MSKAKYRFSRPILMSLAIFFGAAAGGITGCNKAKSGQATAAKQPTGTDVVGLTEAELRAKYPEVAELDKSFDLLVSKNLHPYHAPATHKFLRFGRAYLVAELKDGKVIALHRVSG